MTSYERALFERLRLFIGWQKQRALDDGEDRLADRTAEILLDLDLVLAPRKAKLMPEPVPANQAGNRETA